MRFLALSLLMILCGSASAVTLHHTIPRHHVIVRPSQGFPGYAVPGWAYAAPPPTVHYDDTPSYNDPSKFGGSRPYLLRTRHRSGGLGYPNALARLGSVRGADYSGLCGAVQRH
jgi:hypothetical protein